jgi:hypothetical protein
LSRDCSVDREYQAENEEPAWRHSEFKRREADSIYSAPNM